MGDRIRPGSRGGADQFSWEQIKTDKYRENYLGHSLNAPVGRWQKGRDLQWYAKDKKTGKIDMNEIAAERERIRQEEEDRRLEALGLKEKAAPQLQSVELDPVQKAALFARGSTGLSGEAKTDVVVYSQNTQVDANKMMAGDSHVDKHREAAARIQGLGYQGADAAKSRLSSARPDHELSLDSAFQASDLPTDHVQHRSRTITAPTREQIEQSSHELSSSSSTKDKKKSILSLENLTPKERERLQALLEKEQSKLKKKKDKKKDKKRSRSRSRSREKTKEKRKRSASPPPSSSSSKRRSRSRSPPSSSSSKSRRSRSPPPPSSSKSRRSRSRSRSPPPSSSSSKSRRSRSRSPVRRRSRSPR